jgi:hypothetical protein
MMYSITTPCHYAECHYAECRAILIVMLNVIVLSAVILNVTMLCVVTPTSMEVTDCGKRSSLIRHKNHYGYKKGLQYMCLVRHIIYIFAQSNDIAYLEQV